MQRQILKNEITKKIPDRPLISSTTTDGTYLFIKKIYIENIHPIIDKDNLSSINSGQISR